MSTVVLTRQAEISRARQRNQAVREALRQAEGATLAAVDQGTVIKSINDVMPLFNQQMNALQAKDYTTAAKIYPQMNLKLTIADELVTNPDMPSGAHEMLQYFRGVLAHIDEAIVAAQMHDPSGVRDALASLQADVAASKQYNDAFFRNWDAWNVRNLQPMMNAYHDALRQAKAIS